MEQNTNRFDPIILAAAIRVLVNSSQSGVGPTWEAARGDLDVAVPDAWIQAVLSGWKVEQDRFDRVRELAEKPRKILRAELESRSFIRYVRADMLPLIDLREAPERPGSRPCRLCGLAVLGRSTWHRDCLEAFRAQSSLGWSDLCRAALRRDAGLCRSCGISVHSGPYLSARISRAWLGYLGAPTRRPYEVDHIVPLAHGGPHDLQNLQVLCLDCHKEKTRKQKRKEID